MTFLDILLIGIALAMDCFAVSVTQGLTENRWCKRAVLMAVLFGLFQGGMPLLGYLAGQVVAEFFDRYAPWVALVLLAYIGGKMIYESLTAKEAISPHRAEWGMSRLLVLAVATSIDALATGVIFIPVSNRLWIGISIIALCSFAFSLLGYWIGITFGKKFHFNVELLGGIILVGLGLKIWAQGIFI